MEDPPTCSAGNASTMAVAAALPAAAFGPLSAPGRTAARAMMSEAAPSVPAVLTMATTQGLDQRASPLTCLPLDSRNSGGIHAHVVLRYTHARAMLRHMVLTVVARDE